MKLPQTLLDEFREPTEAEERQRRIDYFKAGAPDCPNGPSCPECLKNRKELGLI